MASRHFAPSPGPDTNAVLSLQHQHRSTAIWEGNDPGLLMSRHHYQMHKWPLDERVRHYVITAGLYGVSRIGSIRIDHALVTALVERWRQETHSFHLPVGEATITLQDVAVLLGLRIDGRPVTRCSLCSYDRCSGWGSFVANTFSATHYFSVRVANKGYHFLGHGRIRWVSRYELALGTVWEVWTGNDTIYRWFWVIDQLLWYVNHLFWVIARKRWLINTYSERKSCQYTQLQSAVKSTISC